MLVAGLGNPGGRYDDTRHNAGFWFVDAVAGCFGESFAAKKSLGAQMAKVAAQAAQGGAEVGGLLSNSGADMSNPAADISNSGAQMANPAAQIPSPAARMSNPDNGDATAHSGTTSGAHSAPPGVVRLLKPDAYMNENGAAVAAAARYFGIAPQEILIAHDEADLPPGAAKLKCGGGEAGHRGLQDVSRALASRDYWRLRLGVGKGEIGAGEHVLRRPPKAERDLIDNAISRAIELWREITSGRMERAMMTLHSGAN